MNDPNNQAPAVASSDLFGSLPPVLDACCGSKAFWFDKHDTRAIFTDKRKDSIYRGDSSNSNGFRTINVAPDMLADFTNLPFPDNQFALVVFDPPHIATLGETSYMAKTYGRLVGDWRDELRRGFEECFRVLRPEGTLIFKWCEIEIPLTEVLALTSHKPLFGHRRKDHPMHTHWLAFLKPKVKAMPRPDPSEPPVRPEAIQTTGSPPSASAPCSIS